MDKEELIEKLYALSNKDEGRILLRVLLNGIGCWIPFASAAASLWSELEQRKFNTIIAAISKGLFDEVDVLSEKVNSLLKEQTREDLIILLRRMFSSHVNDLLLSGEKVPVMVSSLSLQELVKYQERGLLSFRATGASAQMGAGCAAGNHIEEILNPYGMGIGGILQLSQI